MSGPNGEPHVAVGGAGGNEDEDEDGDSFGDEGAWGRPGAVPPAWPGPPVGLGGRARGPGGAGGKAQMCPDVLLLLLGSGARRPGCARCVAAGTAGFETKRGWDDSSPVMGQGARACCLGGFCFVLFFCVKR